MTGYTVHTGTSKKFVSGWDRIFDDKPEEKATKSKAKKKAKKTDGKAWDWPWKEEEEERLPSILSTESVRIQPVLGWIMSESNYKETLPPTEAGTSVHG